MGCIPGGPGLFRRQRRIWVKLKDATELLRKRNLVLLQLPCKRTGAVQALALCEECLAAPQLLFSAPPVMHIDREGMPAGDPEIGLVPGAYGSRDRALADGRL
jgi:hypothetical protein